MDLRGLVRSSKSVVLSQGLCQGSVTIGFCRKPNGKFDRKYRLSGNNFCWVNARRNWTVLLDSMLTINFIYIWRRFNKINTCKPEFGGQVQLLILSARKSENKRWYFYRALIWLLEDEGLDNFSTTAILAKVSVINQAFYHPSDSNAHGPALCPPNPNTDMNETLKSWTNRKWN